MTKSEIAREIASHRKYAVSCACGKCATCKQREYRRKRRAAGKS